MPSRFSHRFLLLEWCVLFAVGLTFHASIRTLHSAEPQPFYSDVRGTPPANVVVVEPWRVITVDPQYGGHWVVAGDIDGNGEIEIVSAQNFNEGDNHFTSAAVSQRLDGTVLWRWGAPDAGRKIWHHDVACQIYENVNTIVAYARG